MCDVLTFIFLKINKELIHELRSDILPFFQEGSIFCAGGFLEGLSCLLVEVHFHTVLRPFFFSRRFS